MFYRCMWIISGFIIAFLCIYLIKSARDEKPFEQTILTLTNNWFYQNSYNLFGDVHIIHLFIQTILLSIFMFHIPELDNRLAIIYVPKVNTKGRYKSAKKIRIIEIKNPICSHVVREISVILRKKGNGIALTAIAGLGIIIISMLNDAKIIVIVTLLTETLICISCDSIFRESKCLINYYAVCGEAFKGFLWKKECSLFALGFCNLAAAEFFLIIRLRDMSASIVLFFLYIFFVTYWNLFYSFVFWKFKAYFSIVDDMLVIGGFIISVIPIVNIAAVFNYYKIGSRKWSAYVTGK